MMNRFWIVLSSVLLTCSHLSFAEIYTWKDKNGKTHFSDTAPLKNTNVPIMSLSINKTIKPYVKLDVPLVSQGKALCGPATIEMLFRYWGINEYNQYDIAYNILNFRPELKRVVNSKILESTPISWSQYPGTGTSTIM